MLFKIQLKSMINNLEKEIKDLFSTLENYNFTYLKLKNSSFYHFKLARLNELLYFRQLLLEGKISGLNQNNSDCLDYFGSIAKLRKINVRKLNLKLNYNTPFDDIIFWITKGDNINNSKECRIIYLLLNLFLYKKGFIKC